MKIVNVTSTTNAYVIIRDLSLKPGASGSIDVDILLLSELKSIRNLSLAHDISISTNDYNYIVSKIASMSGGSGGDAPVKSVNEEIGDVVLDASKIKVADGDTIQEEFSQLSPVAYSGSYLDLSNRPGGTGEPFTVTPWNPYRQEVVDIDYEANNSSTIYVTGHMSKKEVPSIPVTQIDIGYPNSPEIDVVNGSNGTLTTLTISPNGSDVFTKTLAIDEITSVSVNALDSFENSGSTAKGITINFFIVQLEDNEDINTMPIQDIIGKPNTITVNLTNVYLNEYNTYTQISYSVSANNSSVASGSQYLNGDNTLLNFKIENNRLSVANGNLTYTNLSEYGFASNKKYAAIFMCAVNSALFDVMTPFSISLSELSANPEIAGLFPDIGELKVHKDSKLNFSFESDYINNFEYFGLSLAESEMNLNYSTQDSSYAINQEYIDTEGYITLKIDGNHFLFKNVNNNDYEPIYTKSAPFVRTTATPTNQFSGNNTDWYFELLSWKKNTQLNGILPNNVIDGSVLFITNSGMFDDKELFANDYIQLYDNKTKFILNRLLDLDASLSPKFNNLAGEGLKYENNKLGVKLAYESGLEFINSTELRVKTTFDSKYFNYPVLFDRLYEKVTYSNQTTSLVLDLLDGANLYVYKMYPNAGSAFTTVNIQTNTLNTGVPIGKTVTMLFRDFTNNSYITWPSEFVWANGDVPEVGAGITLLVTGIVMGNDWESYTDNKLLCTYVKF